MGDVPAGFRRIERLSPFNALVGPLYEKRDGDAVSIGLAIEQKHTNSRGICHGGVLATLAAPPPGLSRGGAPARPPAPPPGSAFWARPAARAGSAPAPPGVAIAAPRASA